MRLRRIIVPRNRGRFLFWGAMLLAGSGLIFLIELNVYTIVIFGMLRALAAPLWGIPHFGIRLDIIGRSVEEPGQRIEYLCAWEVPLAIGRILMMLSLLLLYGWLDGNDWALRIILVGLSCMRIVTYLLLSRTSVVRDHAK